MSRFRLAPIQENVVDFRGRFNVFLGAFIARIQGALSSCSVVKVI